MLERHVLRVKERVSPDRPFGLGLRLSRRACDELCTGDAAPAFRDWLDRRHIYVFTLNGFAYGSFHGTRVKEKVYAPDWRTPARREYTVGLAQVLAELLPNGVNGSVSTVPGSFRAWIRDTSDVRAMAAHLVSCAEELARIHTEKGRLITLALEPEPACWLETTDDAIRFFLEELPEWTRPYLGLCLDTCHMCVQFENLVRSLEAVIRAGLRIGKVQLGSAVEVRNAHLFRRMQDDVYLHQTRWRRADGTETALCDAPSEAPAMQAGDAARVHFHVPLYAEGGDGWAATSRELSDDFFAAIRAGATEHVEVETYTFNLLPPDWREKDIGDSIARELMWAMTRLGNRS
jgi:sugar phosphate isomerase/epimerase